MNLSDTIVDMQKQEITESGRQAFLAGQDEDSCPHESEFESNPKRVWWFNGYFEARSRSRLKGIYERYPDPE